MKNILFFGDSLTAGYGLNDASSQSYPSLIQQKINSANLSYRVINAGTSGDTSADGLTRLDYWLSQPIDIFALELGINDFMRGVAPSITSNNLKRIIEKVRSKYPNAKLVMLGMEAPPIIPGVVAAEFTGLFRRISNEYQMSLVPFLLNKVAGQTRLNQGDGLHPTAEGYKIIAETVWTVLEKLLVPNNS